MNPELIVSLKRAIEEWSNNDDNQSVMPEIHSWGSLTCEMMATAAAAVLVATGEAQEVGIDDGTFTVDN